MRFILINFLLLSSFGSAAIPFRAGDKTEDPQAYVLSRIEFPEKGLTQFDCAKCSTLRNAIFIAATASCGAGGCEFNLFKKATQEYEYLTSIFLHDGAFQFLKSSHHGLPDIKTYTHLSAMEGQIDELQFDGKKYVKVRSSKVIKSSDLEKNLKAEPVKALASEYKKI